MEFNLLGNEMVLLPEKAIWLPAHRALIIADLHLGKVEHFRASGIALPAKANLHTLSKLESLIKKHGPDTVFFLGDLFHSVKNQSFDDFKTFMLQSDNADYILIKGNHDIMMSQNYADLKLKVVNEYFLGNLWLTHEPQSPDDDLLYNLAGHIHPGIRLQGIGKQGLSLPCFYFNKTQGILPAFGYFTGKAKLKLDKKAIIFAIADDKIIEIPTS